MAKLITVSRATAEIKRLQQYVELVETYEADTLDKWIIKEYAYTNSLVEVVKRANVKGYTINGEPIDKTYAVSIVNGKAKDELHRLLKSGYKHKISAISKISILLSIPSGVLIFLSYILMEKKFFQENIRGYLTFKNSSI